MRKKKAAKQVEKMISMSMNQIKEEFFTKNINN